MTNASSGKGVGWHISVYACGTTGYELGAYNPKTAVAKYYVTPAGLGQGRGGRVRFGQWSNLQNLVSDMPGFGKWCEAGWETFFKYYPKYQAPATYVLNNADFAKLLGSAPSRASYSVSTSSSASSTPSSSSSASNPTKPQSAWSKRLMLRPCNGN